MAEQGQEPESHNEGLFIAAGLAVDNVKAAEGTPWTEVDCLAFLVALVLVVVGGYIAGLSSVIK